MFKHSSIIATAAFAIMLAQSPLTATQGGHIILAQTPVPSTGSSQGVNPSNSLPGGSGAFGASSTSSPTPLSAPPPSGAAQGVVAAPSGQNTGAVSTTAPAAPR